MKDDDRLVDSWTTSRDTGEHAFPELGGAGPHIYSYDVRGVRHCDPPKPCKLATKKRTRSTDLFMPRPTMTFRERVDAEAARLRDNPMGPAQRRDIVPFHKIRSQ